MGPSEESDEVLFGLMKAGSDRAFTFLYNRYWEILLDVAFNKLGSQDDAKDAVQQVFVQIWNRRSEIELTYAFRTYISAALKYKIYDKILQRRKQRSVPLDDLEYLLPTENTTEHFLDFTELRSRVEALVSQLPEKCGLVYRLSREEGLSAKQIAQRLEINEKTVEGHLTKALKVLRIHFRMISIFVFLVFLRVLNFF